MILPHDHPVKLRRVPLEIALSPPQALLALREEPWPFALTGRWAGARAILGSHPLIVSRCDADPFTLLESLPPVLDSGDAQVGADDLPVGGGWFGWLGYRLAKRIEELPAGPPRPVALPDFHLAYYDHLLRLDRSGSWWFEALVSPGREAALERRLEELRALLCGVAPPPSAYPHPSSTPAPGPFAVGGAGVAGHVAAVQDCVQRIAAGEIYQANLCLRLQSSFSGDPALLFARASASIAPPYAAAFQTPWGGIVSLSPELFLRRVGDLVATAPIKGTIARELDPARAGAALRRLRASAKDAAEHVMIIDLMRNDLGRVCEYGSIEAQRPPGAEAHPGLWHLVSSVRGRLRRDAGDGSLLRATFPPGSVTGAPKVQAMRVIAHLESSGRETYTGAIGFVSPCAGLELSVAIRTFELCDECLWLGAGGGIVADSDPQRELEEALLKARPLAATIGSGIAAPPRSPGGWSSASVQTHAF